MVHKILEVICEKCFSTLPQKKWEMPSSNNWGSLQCLPVDHD